ELDEALVAAASYTELAVRNRPAVRVVRRIAELLVDLRLELLRERVLEPVGLRVHLVDGEAEPIREVALEQPMVSQDLQCATFADLRQRDAFVRPALDEAELGEPLRHRGRGGWLHAHSGRERRGRDEHAGR